MSGIVERMLDGMEFIGPGLAKGVDGYNGYVYTIPCEIYRTAQRFYSVRRRPIYKGLFVRRKVDEDIEVECVSREVAFDRLVRAGMPVVDAEDATCARAAA